MNNKQFWNIIKKTFDVAGGDAEQQYILLVKQLTLLEPVEIVDFAQLYHDKMVETYRYELWAAVWMLDGGFCSDDSFSDFRDFLISRGEELYNAVLRDTEVLLKGPSNEDGEWVYEEVHFSSALDIAYANAMGNARDEDFIPFIVGRDNEVCEMPITFNWPEEPEGESLFDQPDRLRQLFPRIYKHVDLDNWAPKEDLFESSEITGLKEFINKSFNID